MNDERLHKALEFANYRQTFFNQKQILKNKSQALLSYSTDGGTFKVTQELIAFVKESLGSYKSPKSIVIVDQLPLTVVGKVLRKDVRKKYWENSDRAVG